MAYVYFPARETNFFPPGPPYLAGLRGFHGLGDYAADLTAYNADIQNWRTEARALEAAVSRREAKILVIDAAYAADLAAYATDKAKWDKEYEYYLVASASWDAAFARYKKENTERSQKIAAAYGLSLNLNYYAAGACLTQAEHDKAARDCVTVKGLGNALLAKAPLKLPLPAASSSASPSAGSAFALLARATSSKLPIPSASLAAANSACGLKALPVCQFGPRPTVRAKPVAPTKAAYPAKPSALRAQPIAPTPPPIVVATPVVVAPIVAKPVVVAKPVAPTQQPIVVAPPVAVAPSPPSSVPVSLPVPVPDAALIQEIAAQPKKSNALMAGLIVAAVAVGGYFVYRNLRKRAA